MEKVFAISTHNGITTEVELEYPGALEIPKGYFGKGTSECGAWCYLVSQEDLEKASWDKRPRWLDTTDNFWYWLETILGLKPVGKGVYFKDIE
jgi:hypothetical protein